jgi:hypothetical protein
VKKEGGGGGGGAGGEEEERHNVKDVHNVGDILSLTADIIHSEGNILSQNKQNNPPPFFFKAGIKYYWHSYASFKYALAIPRGIFF